ncbi:hypothetical protein ACYTPF_09070 [Alteromonas sp. HB246098]
MDRHTIGGIAVGLFGLLWVVFLVSAVNTLDKLEAKDISAVMSMLVASAALVYTGYVNRKNEKWRESEAYLKRSEQLLLEAFEHLSSEMTEDGKYPLNNRMLWITSARLIKRSEQLSKLIIEEAHKDIYTSTRLLIKHRFYSLLKLGTEESMPMDYYAMSPEKFYVYGTKDREPLDESSLVVIFRFAQDTDGVDELKGRFTDKEINKLALFDSRGLGLLMKRVRALLQPKGSTNND